MKKTALSLTLTALLGLSLTACGSSSSPVDEIVNDLPSNADISKLSKSYDGKYLPLTEDSTNPTAIQFNSNLTKATLYDGISGAVLDESLNVVIDGDKVTIKNGAGLNKDLVFNIVKKDGGEYLTKGNTTWDTGITCDKIEEVKTKIEEIIKEKTQEVQDEIETPSDGDFEIIDGIKYPLYWETDSDEVSGDITFNGNTMTFDLHHVYPDGEVIDSPYWTTVYQRSNKDMDGNTADVVFWGFTFEDGYYDPHNGDIYIIDGKFYFNK